MKTSPDQLDKPIQGTVGAIAFGGKGIIRKDGLVIFVPFTAIGDEVLVKIVKKKKNFAEGELLSVITPSKDRVSPLCPYFGRCGGCQLQHLRYAAQLDYKKQCVEDALKRIGNIELSSPVTMMPANTQWHYRRHIQLTMHPAGTGYEIGYIATDNTSLIPVEECVIFTEKNHPLFHQLRKLCHDLKRNDLHPAKVSVLKANSREFLLDFRFAQSLPSNAQDVFSKALETLPFIRGINTSSDKNLKTFGNVEMEFSIDAFTFYVSPGVFIQNHSEQSLAIYQLILKSLEEHRIKILLDLYCGIGILSVLASAKGISVTGIENNPLAIKLAFRNASKNAQTMINFIQEDVEGLIDETLIKCKADAILVNPPRTGLDPRVIQALKQKPSPLLIYMSCMPATLARDVKELSQIYKIESCTAFDMFPQTAHVETLLIMTRKM